MVEELDPSVEVLVEVASRLQRPGGRTYREGHQSEAEQHENPDGSRCEPLEPAQRAREPIRYTGGHRRPRRLACSAVGSLTEANLVRATVRAIATLKA